MNLTSTLLYSKCKQSGHISATEVSVIQCLFSDKKLSNCDYVLMYPCDYLFREVRHIALNKQQRDIGNNGGMEKPNKLQRSEWMSRGTLLSDFQ